MYTVYVNNTLLPALAVHKIYRDIFGPPMINTSFTVLSFSLVYLGVFLLEFGSKMS